MSETKYESKIVSSASSATDIFAVVSDLRNFDKVRDLIPEDKVRDLEFGEDYVRFKMDGLGQKICIRLVDKEENKTLKFGLENMPIAANFWIQLKEVAPEDTRMKLTVKAEIPMMFKMMLGNKLQVGIDQAADMMATFPYKEWLAAKA